MSRRDIFLTLFVILFWGIHYPVIKTGTDQISAPLLLTIRFTLTGLVFLPFCRKITRSQFRELLIFSAYFYMGHLPLLFVATMYLESATVSLIMQAAYPFSILLGWLLYQEKFRWKTTAGLLVALSGLLLVFGSPDITSMLGLTLCIISSVLWAFGSLQMRKINDISLATMTSYSCLLAVPMVATLSFIFDKDQIAQIENANWLVLGSVLAYQVLLMSFAMFIWKQLLSRNSVQYVTAFTLLQPIIAVIAAHFMLGETLSVKAMAGGFLAMLGVAIIVIRKIQKRETKHPEALLYLE